MKIQTVSYEELVSSRDDYGNKKIGATCQVSEGETPEDAFTHLAYWVKEQFYKVGMNPPELVELENDIRSRQERLDALRLEINVLNKRWQEVSAFLEKHGVKVPENEIPF